MKFSCKLGGKCRVVRREQPNKRIAGISLSGEVQENEKEIVYLKLDIDGKSRKAVYPYPWSPATGNLAYCMPQPGTKVYLYFPDCHEENQEEPYGGGIWCESIPDGLKDKVLYSDRACAEAGGIP